MCFRHINEDKRKADGHQVMFDIVNDIENCPVSVNFMTSISEMASYGFHTSM